MDGQPLWRKRTRASAPKTMLISPTISAAMARLEPMPVPARLAHRQCPTICDSGAQRRCSAGPRVHRPGDAAVQSGVRHATTASQIIHVRFRTSASTIAKVCDAEKPSEPASQPCTR